MLLNVTLTSGHLVSIGIALLAIVVTLLGFYFKHVIKIEKQLTALETKVENQGKTLDYVNDKIMNNIAKSGGK
ncbi:MAG: hypothetical protein KDC83_00900 [Flavobacteriales bacterium]|nr:hypothetical protein [Flavobacteriales bacterium]